MVLHLCKPLPRAKRQRINPRNLRQKSMFVDGGKSESFPKKTQSEDEGGERRACARMRGRGSPFERRSSAGRHRFRARSTTKPGRKLEKTPASTPHAARLESMFTLREASGQADRDGAAWHAWPGSKRRTQHDPLDAKRRFGRGTPSESHCRGMPRLDDSRRSKAFQLHDSRPGDCAGGCSGRALGG